MSYLVDYSHPFAFAGIPENDSPRDPGYVSEGDSTTFQEGSRCLGVMGAGCVWLESLEKGADRAGPETWGLGGSGHRSWEGIASLCP